MTVLLSCRHLKPAAAMAAEASADAGPLSGSGDEVKTEVAADGHPHDFVPAIMKAWTYNRYRGGASALTVRQH